MRSERQIMDTILSVVKSSDNIRAAYMNGSRTNPNVEKDELRDYDIVFSVNDVRRMINGRKWLKPFGDIAIMQEPDSVDMAWGENAELNKSYTFLMLFRDHVRIDLHIERTDVTKVVYGSDSLTVPLYDKDGLLSPIPASNDSMYNVAKPTAEQFAGCCNEFYWCMNNVAKGIARRQLPYAMWMYNSVVHPMLIKLLSYRAAMENGFSISLGMSGKYLERYIPQFDFEVLTRTYAAGSYAALWMAIDAAMELFSRTAATVAEGLDYDYRQDWEQAIRDYIEYIKNGYTN